MEKLTKEKLDKLFGYSECILKTTLCFCTEEAKERNEDIITIEE